MSDDDHQLAARLATEAGQVLLELRRRLFDARSSAWQVMEAGDIAAHRYLAAALAEQRPGDVVLSEEGRDDRRRLDADRVWIVDPLDGTNEFGERGRSDWAVHVALVQNGQPIAGAVALPAPGITLATEPAPPLPDIGGRRIRVITSRNWMPRAAALIARHFDAEVFSLGSAGAKAMAVVMGDADVYAHHGGQYEWDNCAPAAVAAAAGFHVSRIDGTPLVFNKPDPWSPDLLICRPELADEALAALWS